MRRNIILICILASCLTLISCSWLGLGQGKVNRFRITEGKYSEKDDLDLVIKTEFGGKYRLADWNDILLFSNKIEVWADSLGMSKGEDNSWMISRDGNRFWRKTRHYYVTRFDRNKPGHYLAHENIDNDFVCLGSWAKLDLHVLAVKK